jgi:hypothetical protein
MIRAVIRVDSARRCPDFGSRGAGFLAPFQRKDAVGATIVRVGGGARRPANAMRAGMGGFQSLLA